MNDTMNPHGSGNPATAEGDQRAPFGGALGTALAPFNAGARVASDQVAPTSALQCVPVGINARAQFVVRCPDGCTGLTLHLGRWVRSARPWRASGAGVVAVDLNGFVEDKNVPITFIADQLHVESIETFGDPVGAFVTDIAGTVAADDSVMIWLRGAGAGPVG